METPYCFPTLLNAGWYVMTNGILSPLPGLGPLSAYNFMLWFLLLFSYACLLNYLCRTFSYDISLLSISSFLGHIGFPFHFMLLHTHFVLVWFSLYPAGTVGISFSNTLFSYAKYNFPSIQFQMLSIVSPVSLCKVFYCRKLIRYCSFVFILIYALYVPGML